MVMTQNAFSMKKILAEGTINYFLFIDKFIKIVLSIFKIALSLQKCLFLAAYLLKSFYVTVYVI